MTKKAIVEHAFGEIGMASYVFALQAEDIQQGLTLLEQLMARFDGQGILLNWPFADDMLNPEGSVEVFLPPYAVSGVTAQLAIDLAPFYGKQPNPTTFKRAYDGFTTMAAIGSVPNPARMNTLTPMGSGNRNYGVGRVFVVNPPVRTIDTNYKGETPTSGVSNE